MIYKRRLVSRFICLFLSLLMLLGSVTTAFAYDKYVPAGNDTGNGNAAPGDGSGGAHLLNLVSIQNTVKDDKDKFNKVEYQGKNNLYTCDLTATMINTYRNFVDISNIFTVTHAKSAAFMPRKGWSNYTPSSLCLNITTGNGIEVMITPDSEGYSPTSRGFGSVGYSRTEGWWNNPSTWQEFRYLMDGTYSDKSLVWSNPSSEMADKYIEIVFSSGSGLYQNVNAIIPNIVGAYWSQQSKVGADFSNYTTPQANDPRGDRGAGYVLAYYTAVVMYSEQQRGGGWVNEEGREMLKKFWQCRNSNSSSEFIILADMAVAGQHDAASNNIAHAYSYVAALNSAGVDINWETLSGWLEERYTSKVSEFGQDYNTASVRARENSDNALIREKSGFVGVAEKVSWMYHYFANWRIAGHTGFLKYTGDSTGYWTEPIGWESSVRMIDAKGGVIGPPGVSYFGGMPDMNGASSTDHPPDKGKDCSDPSSPDYPCDPDIEDNNPSLSVKCDPHSKKVDVECAEDNLVTIKLTANATSAEINDIYNYYTQEFLSKDPNATMQIKYSLDSRVDDGDPGDTDHYNVFSKGSGDFTAENGNTFLSSQKFTTREQLKDFLTGSKNELTLQDTNIKVCDKVTITYIGSMYVCMNGGGKHEDYVAKPKGVNFTDNGNACDTATLYTKETPYYYSDMRHLPVSEIKANQPYGEKYEAMAGVPTTTNLYMGTGATEYMVNVDLQMKTTSGERTFTFKVTENNCYGDNSPCTYASCPGELTDPETGAVTHPEHYKTCPYLGTVKSDGITDHRNNKHPGTCNYTYIIKQKIDTISYMDITDEDLYRLIDFKLKGNSKFQQPSDITLNPDLGYYSYHKEAGYSDGNGRFRFSISLDNSDIQHWGNTSKTQPTGSVNSTHDTCKTMACAAINEVVKTLTTNTVTVVSDYVVLETSEGYQNVMYYELTSNNVPLNGMTVSESDFGTHADMSASNLTCTKDAPAITWPKVPTQDDMWKNNGDCASNWSPTHITTTGYNGEYEDVSGKYSNSNSTSGHRICDQNVEWKQPNLDSIEGDNDFESGVNGRYIKSDINIIDSTTPPPDRKWSATDSIKPVTNGEWDTGHCTVLYKKDINFKNSPGKKWDVWTKRKEAPYSEDHSKINNVVVHNPISNRDAVVISNEKKYDQRYWGELDRPTLPTDPTKCPRDSTCAFSVLKCTTKVPHNNSCYKNTNVGYKCGNLPLNKHVHNSTCLNWSYEVGMRHVTVCNHRGSHKYRVDKWVPANSSYCVCNHTGCSFVSLTFDGQTTQGAAYIMHSLEGQDYKGTDGNLYWVASEAGGWDATQYKFYKDHKYAIMRPDNGAAAWSGWYHIYDVTANYCYSCNLNHSNHQSHYNCHTYVTDFDIMYWVCNNLPNTHVHVPACNRYEKLLVCTDPHHYVNNSQPHDVKDPNNHYPFADTRCYKPCNDDSKHKPPENVTIPGGQPQSTTGVFINIDREFKIYYPDVGDFEQQPNLNGISECVDEKGLGYKNNTDTDPWLRNKFVIYPFNTIDAANNLWGAGEPIDLLKLPSNNKVYQFECLLANSEHNACAVLFHSIANNAPETYTYDDANYHTNYDRFTNHGAKMSVTKKQSIDVVGSIGALTIHDTGDPRFAELFKQPMNNGKWLIPNVVREVDYSLPNKIVADDKDARNEDATKTGYYHSVYGITDMPTGGKNHPYVKLPLVPYKNPIAELQREEMRPGYNLFMDIETIGNYYGENFRNDTGDKLVPWERGSDATGMFTNKMQIKPKYWELNLDTGKYNEVDVYMHQGSTYLPVVMTNKDSQTSEYYYYLDWLNEASRRSYSRNELSSNNKLQNSKKIEGFYNLRLPTNDRDVIGSTDRIYLIDLDRTFIGSSSRYGRDMNTGNNITGTNDNRIREEESYLIESQRWHWTLGLPSSVVFVRAGKECNDKNIKELQDSNSVIVCSLDIKVRGTVWTLEYDGTSVNYSDGNGFKIYPGGKTYEPPTDPKTGQPINDPIVVVYNNKRTSKDDIQTQGSH